MQHRNFNGLRVVAFESRRADEMRKLIEFHKGEATVVASMRELPLEDNGPAHDFVRLLQAGELGLFIALTGVGVRMLARELDVFLPRPEWVEALAKVPVVARGPKPTAALKELEIPVALRVDEPNTWREILQCIDARRGRLPLSGKLIAVQEYGMMNRNLLRGLQRRGARVLRVPVYRWALPEDTAPLRHAVEDITNRRFDVALFTTGTQVWHLFKIAGKMGLEHELRAALQGMVIASVGPSTSEALTEFELQTDLMPEHPKMGHLVKHAAINCHEALTARRGEVVV